MEEEKTDSFSSDKFLIKQIQTIDEAASFEGAINQILYALGNYINADRVYMIDMIETVVINAYEWYREGISTHIDELKKITIDNINNWIFTFKHGQKVFIENIESIKKDMFPEYTMLSKHEVTSFVAFPVIYRGRLRGFIGIENPDITKAGKVLDMFDILGSHIGATIYIMEKYETKLKLERERENMKVVGSLANIYIAMYYIDIEKDSLIEIKSESYLRNHINTNGGAATEIKNAMFHLVVKKYQKIMEDFVDFSKLSDKMIDEKHVSMEFVGIVSGWCRANFIEVDRDRNGILKNVLFAIQRIDNEKRKEIELKDALNYANKLAFKDGLTGVNNLASYNEYEKNLNERIKNGNAKFEIVLFDVNGLKFVNDNYGHDRGNMLLIDACRCICKAFEKFPVFRIGGDEFVAIVIDEDAHKMYKHIDDFHREVDEVNEIYPSSYRLSVAYGISVFDEDIHKIVEDVFIEADERMYKRKSEIKSKPENSWMIRK